MMDISTLTNLVNKLELTIQPIASDIASSLGLVQYLTDYRTIGLNLPRQTGKTRFLVNKFVTEHALLVVPNQILKQDVTRRHPRLSSYVISASEGSGLRYFGTGQKIRSFDYILIDEPGRCQNHFKIVDFLANLSHNQLVDQNTTIIKLGTM